MKRGARRASPDRGCDILSPNFLTSVLRARIFDRSCSITIHSLERKPGEVFLPVGKRRKARS